MILAPVVVKKHIEAEEVEDEQTRVFGFRAAYVFDQSQTEGEPLPDFATVKGNPDQHVERLKQFITASGIALDYDATIAPAHGTSSGGRIRILPGLAPAEEFAVLAHELAHERLHHGERRSETTKTIRETEAEAVAFVVCTSIGLDTNRASADYIQLYNGDKQTLTESLSFIQTTAAAVIAAITEEAPQQ